MESLPFAPSAPEPKRLWLMTTAIPYSMLLGAVALAMYGPGDILEFAKIFLLFAAASSIVAILSYWSLKQASGHMGRVFAKTWMLMAGAINLSLLGFGVIFSIKLTTLSISTGLAFVFYSLFSIVKILQAYKLMLEDAKIRRQELIRKLRNRKKKIQKTLDREALRAREDEVVRRAMRRMNR